jgi:hypothetical protein
MLGEEAVCEPVHPDERVQLHNPRDVPGLEPGQNRSTTEEYRGGIFKLLRSPEIDSKELFPQAYVVWRAGTTTLFLPGS